MGGRMSRIGGEDEVENPWEIFDLIKDGDVTRLKEFVRAIPAVLGLRYVRIGTTLLMCAAYNGKEEVVQYLVGMGVDLGERDGIESAALHQAAWGKHPAVVKLLLGAGADPTATDFWGRNTLHVAAHSGLLGIVAQLTEKVVDINAKDKYGLTPLHEASRHEEVMRLLVTQGADLALVDDSGSSSLHYAASLNEPKAVAVLVELGCPCHLVRSCFCITLLQVDVKGWTALDIATEYCYSDVMALLN